MPYVSDQQRKWAHTATGKKALGGEAAVHEWDEATKGKKLPKYAKSEEVDENQTKHSSIHKLREFLEKVRSKK
jgi:hypothetical protein